MSSCGRGRFIGLLIMFEAIGRAVFFLGGRLSSPL